MTTKIDGVEILNLEFVMDGKRNETEDYDFGSLTLKHDGREYILDTVQTYWSDKHGVLTVTVELEQDLDTFPKPFASNYDLKATDLILHTPEAEFY